ncbi:glycosyltransferase [Candidatus Sumerlaeota bacterium]|nr:glycosyltransferase [Candidatus Sumerlaeota bacterium]
MTKRIGMLPNPFASDEWSRKGNPVLPYLAESIQSHGWEVVAVDREEVLHPERLVERDLRIVHLHWPTAIFNPHSREFLRFSIPPVVWRFVPPRLFWPLWAFEDRFIDFGRVRAEIEGWARRFRDSGIALVWELHDLGSHHLTRVSKVREADALLHRTVFDLACGVVFHEESCAAPVFEEYGGEKPYAVARLGDYRPVYGAEVAPSEARQRLGIRGKGTVFAFVGTPRPNRNPALLCDAFLRVAGPEDSLVLAGNTIDRYVSGGSRDPRIRLFTGRSQPADRIRDVFCAADFAVNHAKRYLTSAVVRAALSYGTPLISYPFGSTIDMARDAFVPIEDTENGLDDALRRALAMPPDGRAALVVAARQRNAERQWQNMGVDCVALYEKILG